MFAAMHPENVKAELRKRYGSVTRFEKVKGLPSKSVADLLRGRTSRRVKKAVEAALQDVEPHPNQSEVSDGSAIGRGPHRLIAGAR